MDHNMRHSFTCCVQHMSAVAPDGVFKLSLVNAGIISTCCDGFAIVSTAWCNPYRYAVGQLISANCIGSCAGSASQQQHAALPCMPFATHECSPLKASFKLYHMCSLMPLSRCCGTAPTSFIYKLCVMRYALCNYIYLQVVTCKSCRDQTHTVLMQVCSVSSVGTAASICVRCQYNAAREFLCVHSALCLSHLQACSI